MTTTSTDLRRLWFEERVRAPWWLFVALGLLLGATTGAMTGVAVKGMVDGEPVIGGGQAVIFYITFALSALLTIFLLINFTMLTLTVSDGGLEFAYGLFRKRFEWAQVHSAEPRPYNWVPYGGWGIRTSTGGRRAWSMLFVKSGVAVGLTEGGKKREYYVSSRRPDELAAAITRGIGRDEDGVRVEVE